MLQKKKNNIKLATLVRLDSLFLIPSLPYYTDTKIRDMLCINIIHSSLKSSTFIICVLQINIFFLFLKRIILWQDKK